MTNSKLKFRYGYGSTTNIDHDQIIVSLLANDEDQKNLIKMMEVLVKEKLGDNYSKEDLIFGFENCVTFFSDEEGVNIMVDEVNKFFDMDYVSDQICYY